MISLLSVPIKPINPSYVELTWSYKLESALTLSQLRCPLKPDDELYERLSLQVEAGQNIHLTVKTLIGKRIA